MLGAPFAESLFFADIVDVENEIFQKFHLVVRAAVALLISEHKVIVIFQHYQLKRRSDSLRHGRFPALIEHIPRKQLFIQHIRKCCLRGEHIAQAVKAVTAEKLIIQKRVSASAAMHRLAVCFLAYRATIVPAVILFPLGLFALVKDVAAVETFVHSFFLLFSQAK